MMRNAGASRSGTVAAVSLVALLFSLAARAQTTSTVPPAPEVTVGEPVTVMVWNRPLVVLRAGIGEQSPADRATRIRERIESLSPDMLPGDVRAGRETLSGLQGILVTIDRVPIFGILPQDVNPESTETLDEVGRDAARRLEEILRARHEALRPERVLRGSLLSLATALLLFLFVYLAVRLRRRAKRLVTKLTRRRLEVVGFDLRAFLRRIVLFSLNVAVTFAVITSIYSWLAFALSQFPYTQPWGEGLRAYLVGLLAKLALGVLRAIPGLFTVTIILIATRFVSRGVASFFDKVERGEIEVGWLEADTAGATRRLVLVLIWVFAVIAAYPYLPGSETEAFKGVSVFLGLMVSLGGVSFVNQIMSGLVVVYSKTFKVGDFVRVGEQEGVVTELGALSTKIMTRAREEITVPNALLVSSMVTNYNRLAGEDGSMVRTGVTIGYDTPWRQVQALLELAAQRTAGIRREPKPRVLQRALSDFYVEYELLAHLEEPSRRVLVLSDLHANIQDAFNEYDVQILSPHFRDQPGQRVVVPKKDWYASPASEGESSGAAPAMPEAMAKAAPRSD